MVATTSGWIDARTLVDLADRTRELQGFDRALAVAEAWGADPIALVSQPIGETNRVVLALREAVWGAELTAIADCPRCAGRAEFVLDCAALEMLHADSADTTGVIAGEVVVRWRAPSVNDLRAAALADDPAATLRARCLSPTGAGGVELDSADLPRQLIDEVESAMMLADPLAEIVVSVDCPECGATFDADVDPASFVLAELDAHAARLLREVDLFARNYGWTESDVFGLSETRREAYVRLMLEARG